MDNLDSREKAIRDRNAWEKMALRNDGRVRDLRRTLLVSLKDKEELNKEIEQLKRSRKIADNFMSGYRRYTWSKQKEIEDLKRELRNEQLFHNRQLKKVIDLEKQTEQRKEG